MTGTIHLIAEGETDVEIVRAILKAKNFNVHVRLLTSNSGRIGIPRLARQLTSLIDNALKLRKPGDCIAVLHDADIASEKNRIHHEQIRIICEKYRKDVALIVARDEIESWLLADDGLCNWLGEKARNCDSERKPSERLNRAVKRKTGHDYGARTRTQALEKLDGSGDKHSDSMRDALAHLHNAPCMRQS